MVYIINLWYYINGYVLIIIRGKRTERLINLAIKRGIYLRDICYHEQAAFMKVDIEGFKRLRPLARKTGCLIKIKKKVGLPFFIYKLTVRRGYVAGLGFFFLTLYIFSSFIWFIEVAGTDKINPEEIIQASRELGLKPGVFKNALETDDFVNELVLNVPEVSWAGLEIIGTKVRIQIVERIKAIETNEEFYSNIVAAKDGLVLDVFILSGQAEVREGDTVSSGQILISGIVTSELEEEIPEIGENEPEEERENFKKIYTKARGTVKARVWYEGFGESTLLLKRPEPTTNIKTSSFIKIGDREFYFEGDGENPFLYSKQEVTKQTFHWKNIKIPVEIVNLKFTELTVNTIKLTPEEALDRAKEQAVRKAREQLLPGIEPVKQYLEIIDTGDEQVFQVRYVIETIEDIGVEKQFVKNSLF